MVLDIATDRTFEARILVINLRGRIDALSAREFDEFFDELIRSGNRFFILQAVHLEYVSSAGIGSLIRFTRRLKGMGGGAVLVQPSDEISMLLEFFGLSDILPAFADRTSAQEHLKQAISQTDYSLEIERERVLRTRIHPHRKEKMPTRRESFPEDRDRDPEVTATVVDDETQPRSRLIPERKPELRRERPRGEPSPAERSPIASPQPETKHEAPRREPERRVEPERRSAPEPEPEPQREAALPDLDEEPASGKRGHGLEFDEYAGDADPGEFTGEADTMSEARREGEGGHGFSEPRIVTCEQCELILRVYRTGMHMCPGCGIEFDVKRDGGISFYEKL